jgi:Protein of unknown function (DUF3102)
VIARVRTVRELPAIAEALHAALKRDTRNILEIGALLAEAREMVDPGTWLRWLHDEFSLSRQTADRFRKVHEFARRLPNLGNLLLRPSALYVLAECPDPQAVDLVLHEAGSRWVGGTRASTIIRAHGLPAPPTDDESQLEGDDDDDGDADDDDDPDDEPGPRPPPPAPLAPAAARDEKSIRDFAEAVKALEKLTTKPGAGFVGIASADDLVKIADFLNYIAAETGKRVAA